jgi:hypothetical protein
MRRAAALKQLVAIREATFESHTLDYRFPMVHEAVPISLLESAEETAAAGIARSTRDLFQRYTTHRHHCGSVLHTQLA